MIKKILSITATLYLLASYDVNAENLLSCGNGEDANEASSWGGGTVQNTSDKNSGAASMQSDFSGGNWAVSPEFTEIDKNKNYRISGFFKSGDDNPEIKVFASVYFYNSEKEKINPYAVMPVSQIAVIGKDASIKGKTLSVVKNDSWKTTKGLLYAVALDVKEDYSDLPNNDFLPVYGIEETESDYELTLKGIESKKINDGMKLRLHRYIDPPGKSFSIKKDEWNELAFELKQLPESGKASSGTVFPGTKFIKVIIFTPEKGRTLLFDDIKVEETVK